MSDSKALVPENAGIESPKSDIPEKYLAKIEEFKEEGMPGLAKVDEGTLVKMFNMYLDGNTYDKISNITRSSKITIMYLSQKFKWFEARQEYLTELDEHIKRRTIETRLASQDFMLTLVQAWHKKIGKKLNKYLQTENDEHLDSIDLKEIDRYLKLREALGESLQPPKSDAKAPTVGLNLGDGVTVTRKGDNEVEITPKQKAIGDILQQYADMRREEEKKK